MAGNKAGRKRMIMAVAALLLGGGVYWYWVANARTLADVGGFVREGKAGFVVTQFAYALGPDATATGSCPNGMFKSVTEIFQQSPEGQRRAGEDDEAYTKRLEAGGKSISVTADGKDYCTNPALAPVDPHARYVLDANARADGLNLDGKVSRSARDAASGRLDFTGLDGTQGVDNQFRRLVGCVNAYQSSGNAVSFGNEMYSGSWGILIALDGVDDLRNDDEVTVLIASNADPMQLSPSRAALEYATYALDPDPDYRSVVSGRLTNGVLTTDVFDYRFRRVTNAMYVERPLMQARINATLSKNGVLKGYLAGYTPVEKLYDFQFGYRTARTGDGQPADPRRIVGTANGAARTMGYTCQGMYQGLHRLADGDPEPKTGKFRSISTQYAFEARPAFVVDVETSSRNDTLVKND